MTDEREPGQDSWNEWSRYVLNEMKRMNAQLKAQSEAITNLKIQLEVEKTKRDSDAKLHGAVAGFLTALPSTLVAWFKG